MWATSVIISLPLRLAFLSPAHLPAEWVAHFTGIRTKGKQHHFVFCFHLLFLYENKQDEKMLFYSFYFYFLFYMISVQLRAPTSTNSRTCGEQGCAHTARRSDALLEMH